MDWIDLLSWKRIGLTEDAQPESLNDMHGRSQYARDADRLIFSSYLRRMQDKTQVHSLKRSDYVRTRLTHSLEVASVGRTLGCLVGDHLVKKYKKLEDIGCNAPAIGDLLYAACLAHDIGNPPFGHVGEDIIQHWFFSSQSGVQLMQHLTEQEQADFTRFEGNAQGFRILANLGNTDRPGGLQMTYAVLGTFMKYPKSSVVKKTCCGIASKKHGFFSADQAQFEQVVHACGMHKLDEDQFCRHPLAYLMEAADDICYRIVDIEDGYRANYLTFEESYEAMRNLIPDSLTAELDAIVRREKKIEFLRSRGIHYAIREVVEAFIQNEEAMLAGSMTVLPLIEYIPMRDALDRCQDLARVKLYKLYRDGSETLPFLMEKLGTALLNEWNSSKRHMKVSDRDRIALAHIPDQFREGKTLYEKILGLTDFVSGMTDNYAHKVCQHLEFTYK